MNNADREYLDGKFCELDRKVSRVHDDVLVLKTQRSMAIKAAAVVGGVISLITTIVIKEFWR